MQKQEHSFLVIPPPTKFMHNQKPPGVLYFNIPIPELLQILLKQ